MKKNEEPRKPAATLLRGVVLDYDTTMGLGHILVRRNEPLVAFGMSTHCGVVQNGIGPRLGYYDDGKGINAKGLEGVHVVLLVGRYEGVPEKWCRRVDFEQAKLEFQERERKKRDEEQRRIRNQGQNPHAALCRFNQARASAPQPSAPPDAAAPNANRKAAASSHDAKPQNGGYVLGYGRMTRRELQLMEAELFPNG